MRDGCGRGHNEFAVRVQNHHVRFSFHKMAILFEFIHVAAAGLDTLRCKLRERCHCGRLPSHYRRARTQDYLACWTRTRHDFSLTCHSVQSPRQPLSRRAISGGSFTVAGGSSSFVSKVLGANCKRANMLTTLILWLINSPCELTGSNL